MFWDIELFARSTTGLFDSTARRQVPYGQLLDQVAALEKTLRFDGKALIALFCDNSIAGLAAYLAALRSGHAAILANAATDPTLQRRIVEIYQPEILLSTGTDVLPTGYTRASSDLGLAFADRPARQAVYPDTAVLLSTSGTTGSPKMIRLSYRNLQANAESIANYLGVSAAERTVTSLPVSYSYGLSVINSHLLTGADIVCTNASVVTSEFWSLFNEQACTSFAGVPFSYMMLERLRLEKLAAPSLRTLTQAGGRLAPEKVRVFAEIAKERNMRFFVMYGQTEATARISYVPWERLSEKIGSVGIAIPGGHIRIMNEGTAKGEIVYEGPNVMLGYAESRADLAKGNELQGVLHTGDVGYKDADGFLYVTGRLKRFIKLFGLRLNLDEIEKMLEGSLSCPVACVGTDDSLHVLVQSTNPATVAEAKQRVTALYKIHHSVVHIHDTAALPVNASGKKDYGAIERDLLRHERS